ncbi:MAG: MupG family TIM beta-alpha barrel fold protein [Clostridiaceae bacterium]
MHKLGISVYPEHSTKEKDDAYMKLASSYGFTRLFTCLLSVEKSREDLMEEFTAFTDRAHELGFEVSVDTNPEVFAHLGAKPMDLSAFAQMHVDIVRLDGHFDDFQDMAITHNPYGIKIEFNGSSDTSVDHLLRHGADIHNMTVCHNFYPERYTGLGWNTFMNFNKKWKSLGLHTAAFVSSNNDNTYGPWPVYAGLPTCESDRGLPIDVQVRHLLACNMIDDIFIGNAYATEEELKAMSEVDLTKITFKVDLEEEIGKEEEHILYDYLHAGRTDASDFFIRSSRPRTDYRTTKIPYRVNNKEIYHRGDVVIVNDNLAHYRGELEVILREIPNDGERNLIGRIPSEEMIILDLLEKNPDFMFGFIK